MATFRRFAFLAVVALLVLLLLLDRVPGADSAATKKKKRKGKKKSSKRTSTVAVDGLGEVKIEYKSEDDKERQLRELTKNKKAEAAAEDDPEEQAKRLSKLVAEEDGLRQAVEQAIKKHGEFSREKATALHELGRNVYQQGKFEDVVDVAEDIVKIHEVLDGPEAFITAEALGNVASVAHRLGKKDTCRLAMERALYIMIKTYGAQSKEVLLHRGKMLTFQIPDGRESAGMSHEAYLEYLDENE